MSSLFNQPAPPPPVVIYSRGDTPASVSGAVTPMSDGGGSGDVHKLDPGMDDPYVKADLEGSSGRGETGGNWLSKYQPRDSSFNRSGSPTTPHKSRKK